MQKMRYVAAKGGHEVMDTLMSTRVVLANHEMCAFCTASKQCGVYLQLVDLAIEELSRLFALFVYFQLVYIEN